MPNLLIIPSIDIKEGKALRTIAGIPELNCNSYSSDPLTLGLLYRAENAKCVHLVDFDSAQNDDKINFPLIEEICNSIVIPVQMGGGIKTFEEAKTLLDIGIYRLVIGSMAFTAPSEFKKCIEVFGPKRITAAIDVVDDELVIHSRLEKTGQKSIDVAKLYASYGIERVVVADITRNGKMNGPNTELSYRIASETGLKVTHAGGISGLDDLNKIRELQAFGVDSVIVGRALYENRFGCQKIWRLAESGIFN